MTDTTPTSNDEHDQDENRHDQLTTAPNATEADAAPRIDVTDQGDGITRIDIRDDAAVRPGADPDDTHANDTHADDTRPDVDPAETDPA